MKEKIVREAKDLGFNLVGFAKPGIEQKHLKAYKNWLENKFNAGMGYMNKEEKRRNISKILENGKTVICLATNYYHSQPPLRKGMARVARYAYGRDYHKIIGKRLKKLKIFINSLKENTVSLEYIDTGPILERAYAEKSGLGFIGKNSCLITKQYGSWVFLSEILTSLEIEADENNKTAERNFDICGSCGICMEACPTKAIIAPGVIDASKCISYLSIENKGKKIPIELRKKIAKEKRIFGCDKCQEVCPHNAGRQAGCDPEFLKTKIGGNSLSPNKILKIKTDDEFKENFAGSPLMRAKRKNLQMLAGIIAKNY